METDSGAANSEGAVELAHHVGAASEVSGALRIPVHGAVLVGAALRLAWLGSKSLWFDEILSIHTAQLSLGQLSSGTVEGYHPPLYFLVLGEWLKYGTGTAHIRLLSALSGTLVIPVLYVTAKLLMGRRVAISAAWLTSLAPMLVWYAQEARQYSLLLLLSSLALLGLCAFVIRPKIWWWLLYVVATVGALYTHYGAVLSLAVQAGALAILLVQGRRLSKAVAYLGLGWATAALLCLPWIRTPAAQEFLGKLTSDAFYVDVLTTGRAALPDRLQSLATLDYARVLGETAIVGAVAAIVALATSVRLGRRHRASIVRALRLPVTRIVAMGLFIVLLVVSVAPRGYTVKRYTLVLWPAALLGFAWLWPWHTDNKKLLGMALALSLLGSIVNVVVVPKPQWQQATAYVLSEQTPGDIVLLSPTYTQQVFDYYTKGQVPTTGVQGGDTAATLAQLFSQHPRLWFVYHTTDVGVHQETIKAWLNENALCLSAAGFYRVRVELYQLR